jgi:hypothetical protein
MMKKILNQMNIQEGIVLKVANPRWISWNQWITISSSINLVKMARNLNWRELRARSPEGETMRPKSHKGKWWTAGVDSVGRFHFFSNSSMLQRE